MKNHLKINHPIMNPETKSREYHLIDSDPIWKISGSTCQYIASKSTIVNSVSLNSYVI